MPKTCKFCQASMNNIKVKAYKTVLKEVAEQYDGPEDFINNRIEEICSQEGCLLGR